MVNRSFFFVGSALLWACGGTETGSEMPVADNVSGGGMVATGGIAGGAALAGGAGGSNAMGGSVVVAGAGMGGRMVVEPPTHDPCPEDLALAATELAHPPMLGYATPDSSLVWLRTKTAACVQLLFGTSANDLRYRSEAVTTETAQEFTAHVNVTGLEPATTYYYKVLVNDEEVPEPVRTFTTFPEPGSTESDSVTLAYGGCLDHPDHSDDLAIGKVIESVPADFFIWLGDNHYGDYRYDGDWRPAFQRLRSHVNWLGVWPALPHYAIWDDHDFIGNDTAGADAPDEKRVEALDVFKQYWANPSYGTQGTPGVFHQFAYGDLVEVFMLDGRYHRDIDQHIMLGDAQTTWLKQAVKAATAPIKIIVSGSQFLGCTSGDSWAPYTAERNALFEWIHAEQIPGVILMSSDRHRSEVGFYDQGEGYPLYEFSSSPLSSGLATCDCTLLPNVERSWCYDEAFNVQYMDITRTADDITLKMRALSETGEVVGSFELKGSQIGL